MCGQLGWNEWIFAGGQHFGNKSKQIAVLNDGNQWVGMCHTSYVAAAHTKEKGSDGDRFRVYSGWSIIRAKPGQGKASIFQHANLLFPFVMGQ